MSGRHGSFIRTAGVNGSLEGVWALHRGAVAVAHCLAPPGVGGRFFGCGVGGRPYGVGARLHGLPAGVFGRTLLAGVCLAGVMGSG
jgi:hypothetical protein